VNALLILVGIALSIIKANKYLIVPDFLIWICFIAAGAGCTFSAVQFFHTYKK
jgi:hypothetical protein